MPTYIGLENGKHRVRIPHNRLRINGGHHDTLEDAIRERNRICKELGKPIPNDSEPDVVEQNEDQPTIEGVYAEKEIDVRSIWSTLITQQKVIQERQDKRKHQYIRLPNKPVAIALLSDLHLGNAGTDYASIQRDAEIIRDTEGMFAGFHGDGTDNWVVSKLVPLQHKQPVTLDNELLIFRDWTETIAHKLLWWVDGNHDNWTSKLVGISQAQSLLEGCRVLYDHQQCVFTLHHGEYTKRVIVRHKWRFGSVYNPTHGLEVGWDRGDIDYDWAIGGHTHIGTYCRPFHRHGKKRYAILTGTYKMYDGFGEEIGLPAPKDSGCGAFVLPGDGRQIWFEELTAAADYLKYLRGGNNAHYQFRANA